MGWGGGCLFSKLGTQFGPFHACRTKPVKAQCYDIVSFIVQCLTVKVGFCQWREREGEKGVKIPEHSVLVNLKTVLCSLQFPGAAARRGEIRIGKSTDKMVLSKNNSLTGLLQRVPSGLPDYTHARDLVM